MRDEEHWEFDSQVGCITPMTSLFKDLDFGTSQLRQCIAWWDFGFTAAPTIARPLSSGQLSQRRFALPSPFSLWISVLAFLRSPFLAPWPRHGCWKSWIGWYKKGANDWQRLEVFGEWILISYLKTKSCVFAHMCIYIYIFETIGPFLLLQVASGNDVASGNEFWRHFGDIQKHDLFDE